MGRLIAAPFSMSCLNSIVVLGACPDEGPSKSGFTLLSAPGISIKGLADTANENYMSGANLAMKKKDLAILQVKNDFLGALQANKVVPFISSPTYTAGLFVPNTDMGLYAGERGVTLHKNTSYRGSLRQTFIKSIQLFPLDSGSATLKIYDGNNVYTYAITLIANQVNTFDETQLSGFPYVISGSSHAVRVVISNAAISFSSIDIKCLKGCNGTMPNECGWIDGWNGTGAVKDEGYGINIEFYCECNYDKVLCDLSNSFIGELVWLQWQIKIWEEHYLTNRFENWTIYNRGDIKDNVIPDLQNKYNAKWNDMMGGLINILSTYRDECLNCRKLKRVQNV